MKTLLFVFLIANVNIAVSQYKFDESKTREYDYLIIDSPTGLYTMRQYDENYQALYRVAVRGINKVSNKWVSMGVQLVSQIFLSPYVHEEGHRSVITKNTIGSISSPLKGSVVGITDAQLKDLRDTNLPDYLRLHSGGTEADYAYMLRSNSLVSWNKESREVLWIEYAYRKLALTLYYIEGIRGGDINAAETENDLKNDVVGHDIYGYIRHMYRPEMEFYRYTKYADLTDEEKAFGKRVGQRSFLNFVDPFLFRKVGFDLSNGKRINAALGYALAPFGDFIDQHVWLKTNKLNMHYYLREFQNKEKWFPGFGAEISDLNIFGNLSTNVALHGWQQPKDLKFMENNAKTGGAVDIMLKYHFYFNQDKDYGFSTNLGIVGKTQGFLLENMYLEGNTSLRFGLSAIF